MFRNLWLIFLPMTNGEGYVFFLCWFVCLFISNIMEKCVNRFSWNFQDRSGMEQGPLLDRLFHSWLDYFIFLKLGMMQVCALGVLLVTYKFHINRFHKKIPISIISKIYSTDYFISRVRQLWHFPIRLCDVIKKPWQYKCFNYLCALHELFWGKRKMCSHFKCLLHTSMEQGFQIIPHWRLQWPFFIT